ncbi:MAG: exodeoxyribonuclease III [Betaproteobacteria bacterium]|nr:exodeoxyribonuclease III [Betaproteobacteria bacterium]
MRLASWNVNSLKVRLPHLLDWLELQRPDVVCLQETKLEDSNFPFDALQSAGYHVACAGQKTYNGVAILSREPLTDVVRGIPGWQDEQQRVLTACIGAVRVVCVYVPNGQSVESDKYRYKLEWLAALKTYLQDELRRHAQLAVLGDYNIAPTGSDVYDPQVWKDVVLVSAPEREAFSALLGLGLVDSFSLFEHAEPVFTWWDYRMGAFRRNMGLRIDHILLSQALAGDCSDWRVDLEPRRRERPSDHAPVLVDCNPDMQSAASAAG